LQPKNRGHYATGMPTISVRLPDNLLAELHNEAKARRMTKSGLVRESLEKALLRQSPASAISCYDLVRDLVGTMKGLPADLADNPKYLEGLGKRH
jgi:ribbon-helix-helix CopG family protein